MLSDLPFIYSHWVSIYKVQQEQSTGGLFNVGADKASRKKKVSYSVTKSVRSVLKITPNTFPSLGYFHSMSDI